MADEKEVQTSAPAPSPKKKHNKAKIAGIIVAVIVVLGIGFWVYHTTPSFCGNVCHSSMYEHLTNFDDGPGLAQVHKNANLGCLDCHEADIQTQVSEVMSQLSGNYSNLGLSDRYYVDNQTCLNCHGGSYEALAQETDSLGSYNPHNSPHGQINCDECHKGHSAQVDLCGECHANGGQEMIN